MVKWLFGIPYEVAFWEASYRNKQARESLMAFSHYGQTLQLPGFDAQAFFAKQKDLSQALILDVGAGMTYLPGNKAVIDGQNVTLNVHYVDPLATYYNRILKKYQIDRPQVEFAMMEYLSACYPKHDVTLVMIQNALDHSANPVKGVLEAIDALKQGGVLYLNHHPNEAEYENYRGFHQFNITVENQQLIIWNKTERYNINELLRGIAQVETSIMDNNPVAVITKQADVPESMIDRRADIQRLSKALIDYSIEVNSPTRMIGYHCRLFFYRMAQWMSKLFSFRTRQRIKKIINLKQ